MSSRVCDCARKRDALAFQPLSIWKAFMNENELKGNWQMVKGKVREKWGKLTDQDLEVIAGKRDQLVGKLRERYGHAQAEAERSVMEFVNGLPTPGPTAPKRP